MKFTNSASLIVCGLMALACSAGEETAVEEAEAPVEEKTSTVPEEAATDRAAPLEIASVPVTEDYNEDRNAYFGDLHIHTKLSFDAYIFNVRGTPDDVYRFAKGEMVKHPIGYEMQLEGPPLDFVAVTDHGEYLGILENMNTEGTELSNHPLSSQLFSSDPVQISRAFTQVAFSLATRSWLDGLKSEPVMQSAWDSVVEAANRHYEPGRLTTFIAYEYTSAPGASNLHRNVVFRGAEGPAFPFTAMDSQNPEDLWAWLDQERDAGRDGFAIPHNSNVSNNAMFEMATYNREPFTPAYADLRMRNEPIVEMTQIKGTSETHPAMSPNDEWAGFENFSQLLGTSILSTAGRGDYIRGAYRTGLEQEASGRGNPYKFGLIGASDSHLAASSYEEDKFFGKVGVPDGTAARRGSTPGRQGAVWADYNPDMEQNPAARFSRFSAAGLAGVWAEENTREAIFDAMRRKETYATSGTRMKVRFFAGDTLETDLLADTDMVARAYDAAVPMGGDMKAGTRDPRFLVWAVRDPRSAPLQRLQIVKGWMVNGGTLEKVFDVACSDGAEPDPATHRCPDNGAGVNLTDCSFPEDLGAAELKTVWQDPEFDPAQRAFYYVRVLENPTCRWSTWDALRAGVPPSPHLSTTIQERAWSSPVWYNPS